ncbi:exopolysaccharide biosynthesis protein [Chelatococcus reniformis]|uniref:Exopolysaccharide biosynthesis protein n=2 Tax=Chelatococcus reniformis TaxID=1494448 RepID=A0A916XGS3_9HYPH|nr:exopolysaccharide biosynthesis protein [Chelatococcus reniformis]
MLDDQPFPVMSAPPFAGPRTRDSSAARHARGGLAKRAFDICVAATAIILLLPLMAIVAILIMGSMGAPIFFGHQRIGLGGKVFRCYKFRTMVRDGDRVLQEHLRTNPEAAAEWRDTRKLADDPRITFVGRVLRSSSLDELPQLVNVLRGDMSCVGPRPIVHDEITLYGPSADDYLRTRPGITGAWQVSGRSSLSYAERVAIDSDYVRNWSFWTDLTIIVRTIPALVRTHQTS